MPFINKKHAFKLLDDMIAGKQNCIGDCRRIWLRNIGYALKTETNPLKLTRAEHKKLTAKLVKAKDRKKHTITRKIDKNILRVILRPILRINIVVKQKWEMTERCIPLSPIKITYVDGNKIR
jgi:hypothetical protein